MNKKILWITRTAVLIALLIVMQMITKSFTQYVTGSIVNLIIIVAAAAFGIWTGVAVAVISPVFGVLFGVGPAFPVLIPFIMLGNLTIALIWGFADQLKTSKPSNNLIKNIITAAVAAAAKFLILYVGVVQVAVRFLLSGEPQALDKVSAMFTFPQLITASIGGAIAVLALPLIKRGVKTRPGA